jgi:hypothetical protein
MYAYPSLEALFAGEATDRAKVKLPGSGGKAVPEKPS